MSNKKIKLVLVLALLLLAGFLFTSLVSYFTAHDSIATQVEKTTLPLTSDNIYSEIQRDLLNPVFISSMMANDTFVRDWVIGGETDPDPMIKYLREIQQQYDTVTSFFVSEQSRNYYHSSGVLKQVSESDDQDGWYFRARDMRDDYEINVDSDTADQTSITIFINHKVRDYTGEVIGVIGVGLALYHVRDIIQTYQQRYGRQIYFTDTEGLVTLHDQSFDRAMDLRQMTGLAESATQILTSPSTRLTYQRNGRKVYLNSRLVPEFGWYLIVEQQQLDDETRVENALIINLLVSAAISLIILLLVSLIISGYQKRLEAMATTDQLTGAANRQVFDVLFTQALSQSRRQGIPLSAIMIDIDLFKQINDSYGHPAGDAILKNLTRSVKNSIRESDILFRWGGEEFLVLLPASHRDDAEAMARGLCTRIANETTYFSGHSIGVTISCGVATMGEDETTESLINRVDAALYEAKRNGRNRVEAA